MRFLPVLLCAASATFSLASATHAQTAVTPTAFAAGPAPTPSAPTNVATVYEQVLNVTGGDYNADVVVHSAKSNNPTLTSRASVSPSLEETVRRTATAELSGSYDGVSTFTAKLNAYGSREDSPKSTTVPANVLASSRASFSFTVSGKIPYSLNGAFNFQVGLPTGNSVAETVVTNTDTGLAVFAYDHRVATPGGPVNTSGTLDPGNYQLLGAANFGNVNSSGGSSNGSASSNRLDFLFKVGEAMSAQPGAAIR